jgi:hypothetical protein
MISDNNRFLDGKKKEETLLDIRVKHLKIAI